MLPPERQEEKEPADWGEVFTILLAHTGLSYEEIGDRTVPQVEAILGRIGKHICLRAGVPISESEAGNAEPDEEHSVEDALAFIAQFQGL